MQNVNSAKIFKANLTLAQKRRDIPHKSKEWCCIRMDPLWLSTPLLGKTQTPKRIQAKEGDSCVSQEYSRYQEQTPDNVVTEGEVIGVFMFHNLCQKNPCQSERKIYLIISGRSTCTKLEWCTLALSRLSMPTNKWINRATWWLKNTLKISGISLIEFYKRKRDIKQEDMYVPF